MGLTDLLDHRDLQTKVDQLRSQLLTADIEKNQLITELESVRMELDALKSQVRSLLVLGAK